MARVYQTKEMGEAHIRAALVENQGEADLCVHKVSSWGLANGDALWYITDNKQDADVWVYFGSQGMSEVKVYFVDNYGMAGWQVAKHRLKGRFRGY